ncbi:MAG: hypothetical protein LCI02_09960 [Proteobacteria bacterium]|nr:hypothetical protein [Pseudomonadota bacterium]
MLVTHGHGDHYGGAELRQGDAEILLPLTPGHTLGTISPIIEVKSGARSWRAVIWGGTGFNFGRDLDRMDAYIRSTERMQQLVREQRVEVLLSNHPSFDFARELNLKVE